MASRQSVVGSSRRARGRAGQGGAGRGSAGQRGAARGRAHIVRVSCGRAACFKRSAASLPHAGYWMLDAGCWMHVDLPALCSALLNRAQLVWKKSVPEMERRLRMRDRGGPRALPWCACATMVLVLVHGATPLHRTAPHCTALPRGRATPRHATPRRAMAEASALLHVGMFYCLVLQLLPMAGGPGQMSPPSAPARAPPPRSTEVRAWRGVAWRGGKASIQSDLQGVMPS